MITTFTQPQFAWLYGWKPGGLALGAPVNPFPDYIGAFVPKDEQHFERVNVLTGLTFDQLQNLIHSRGFSIDKEKHQLLFEASDDIHIVFQSREVVRLAGALLLKKKYKPNDVNKFIEQMKQFSIYDRKSIWPEGMTKERMIHEKFVGGPIDDAWLDGFEEAAAAFIGIEVAFPSRMSPTFRLPFHS